MKQTILIFLLLWSFLLPALSQKNGYTPQRVESGYIYFKDGTITKGEYIYSSDLTKIRVTTKGESRLYDSKDVEKVSRKSAEDNEKKPFTYKSRKITSITEAGMLFGNPDNDSKTSFTLSTSLNYALMNGLSAGIGTGVEFHHGTYLPVTANVHYRFGTNRISPFATIQAGYLIALESTYYQPRLYEAYLSSSSYYTNYYRMGMLDAKGGVVLNPAVGAIIETNHGFGVSLSVGYRYHQLKYEGDRDDYKLRIDHNRLSLKIGIIF